MSKRSNQVKLKYLMHPENISKLTLMNYKQSDIQNIKQEP